MNDLLSNAAQCVSEYITNLKQCSIYPEALARLSQLGGELPDCPTEPAKILELLNQVGSPATVASAGARYFGVAGRLWRRLGYRPATHCTCAG